MNHNSRGQGQATNNDQSALSLLVNAADSRDAPRGLRDSVNAVPRSLAETLRLRGLAGDGTPSLEEQLLLQQQQQQQQQQSAYGAQANLGFLSQLRDQNLLLAQLSQQQQLASLLSGSQNHDMRQALAAAQMRQNQAAQHLTSADILALSRSGALSGLSSIFGGGVGFGGATGQTNGFGGNQAGGFMPGNQGVGYGGPGAHGLASEIEGLQRLEELERRQRLLAATAEARGNSPSTGRVESTGPVPPLASGVMSDHATSNEQQLQTLSKIDNSQTSKLKSNQSPLTEAVPPPETTKEELEKTPGSVIVPCRARGMPMDHNFKTAFFVIPENVKHGEELICSYFACRNAGIKFRYCSHCKVPVAKRNFRKRHKHGGDIIARTADDDSAGDDVPVKRGIPSQIMAGREEAEEADGISSQSADSSNTPVAKNNTDNVTQKNLAITISPAPVPVKPIEEVPRKVDETAVESAPPSEAKISEERRNRWISLLAKRPSTKDGDSMSGWLMEVLAVSDLETPLKASSEQIDDNKVRVTKKNDEVESKPPENDSRKSDNGNSSNDDSLPGDNKKDGGGLSSPGAFGGGVVKKKRPAADLLKDGSDQAKTKNGSFVRGSFAEWKERKKQKKQSKIGNSQSSVPHESV